MGAVEINHVGGTYGGARKPTDFICLILKMLQIQIEKEVVIELIRNQDYKYIRLLGAFYLRLTGKVIEIYHLLEPLYNDYRKIRLRTAEGIFILTHVDEIIDNLFRKNIVFDTLMPRIKIRNLLEAQGNLKPRVTILKEDFKIAVLEAQAEEEKEAQITEQLMIEIKLGSKSEKLFIDETSKFPRDRIKNASSSIQKTIHKCSKRKSMH